MRIANAHRARRIACDSQPTRVNIFTNEACGHALAHGNRRIVGETTKPR
jgi:hypothetical protein